MLLLSLNKQLDLQSWLTQVGRDLAKAHGWYDERREVQRALVTAIACLGLASLVGLTIGLRRVIHQIFGAVLGLGLLAAFVSIRAASFHHADQWLGSRMVHLNWVLEYVGLALIALSAWRQPRTPIAKRDYSIKDRA
jgi:phosphate/sulfate permease